MFPEHVERSFLDPEYSFVAVRRILRTIFAKQKFAQLRTNYILEYYQLYSRTNVRPVKTRLYLDCSPRHGFGFQHKKAIVYVLGLVVNLCTATVIVSSVYVMHLVVNVCTATVIVTSVCVTHLVVNVCTATVIVTSVYIMYFVINVSTATVIVTSVCVTHLIVNVCTALGVTSVYVIDLFVNDEQLLV